MDQIQKTELEQVQEEAEAPEINPGIGGRGIGNADALHASLDEVADGFDVKGFKCVKCGLAHMHDTTKHRSGDSFDMSDSDAASQDYNPNCHCGVQELGRRGSDFGVDENSAASTARSAPIPDETAREMNSQFGGL